MQLIGISSDGRYFIDGNGLPVFWLGDTQWELFRLFHVDEARAILVDRQRKGMNVVLVMLTGVKTGLFRDDGMAPYANLEGHEPWVSGDPLKPNEKYFEHIDNLIHLGSETGQTLVVGIYHQWHDGVITLANARAWARWVGERYSDVPGIMWCMYPKAAPEYVPICRELAVGLMEGDKTRHRICVHPDPAVASSSFMHEEPWMDFNMIQTCMEVGKIAEAVVSDYRRSPQKPVVMAEGAYEGEEFGSFQTAYDIRKQAWWTFLSGGFFVYGHNDAWMYPRKWEDWLDAPGSRQMLTFRDIATSLPGWWKRIPDQSILGYEASSVGQAVAARSADGLWTSIYLPEPMEAAVRLDKAVVVSKIKAYWVEPASGVKHGEASFAVDEGLVSFSTPEGWQDALLMLEHES